MAIIILARILDPKNLIGFRILDTQSNVATGVSYASMVDVLKKGKTKVLNVELKEGKVVGTNGSLDRYTAIDMNNKVLNGKTPVVIVKQVGCYYTVTDYVGELQELSNGPTVVLARKNGIANGKVITHGRTQYISAIKGTYEI